MTAHDYGYGPQTDAEREAVDQAYARALRLLQQPPTWQQRRQAERAAAVARRLEHLERNRRRGIK